MLTASIAHIHLITQSLNFSQELKSQLKIPKFTKMYSILLLTALVSSALALPQGPIQSGPGPWYVTNYNPGCGTSPAGCAYSFDISYTPSYGSSEPAFSTSCQGTDIQGAYKPCADVSVSSNDVPGVGNSTLFVQHVYTQGEATYTITGNATITEFETDGQSFTIVPNLITAVA